MIKVGSVYNEEKYLNDTRLEMLVEENDNVLPLLEKGYKLYIPEGLCIEGHTGIVVKST